MFRLLTTVVALATLFLTVIVPASAQTLYVVTDLGTFGGGVAVAKGINNAKPVQVVGYSTTAADQNHGFVWQNGVMSDIGVFQSGQACYANAINDAGQIVGYGTYYDGTDSYWLPFITTGNGVLTSLGRLSNGGGNSATSINKYGQVVGFSEIPVNQYTAIYHAFYWDSINGMQDLGTVDGDGGYESFAFGINDSDQVVGDSQAWGANAQAALWNSSGISDLGTLGGPGSEANAINDKGQVVGAASENSGYRHAFLWESATGMFDLGTLPNTVESLAYAINASGQVVGYARDGGNDVIDAFLWAPIKPNGTTGAMQDLNTLISPNSGWVLQYAYGINNAGQIVGSGLVSSTTHAFLLTPVLLTGLTLKPSTVPGSLKVTGTVTLSTSAPKDVVVTLHNTNLAATAPASVTIPANASSAAFTITTTAVTTTQTGKVTATYNGVTMSKTLKVQPITVKSITLTPNPVVGGNSVSGKVTLEAPAAPGSITVTLASSNASVANPTISSITIPAGQSTGTFSVSTSTVTTATSAYIFATANNLCKSKMLKVNP